MPAGAGAPEADAGSGARSRIEALLPAVASLPMVLAILAAGCASPPEGPIRAPFVTTPRDVVHAMLRLARVTEDDLVYDLGCGDGRIVVAAARDFGARAVGFDIDPERVAESRANVVAAGVSERALIEQADVFDLDLRPASVVTLYLLQRLNDRLVPQLEQLEPGSRIVSHQFRLRGLRPRRELRLFSLEDRRHHSVFLYVAPLEGEPRFGEAGRAPR